MYIRLLNIPGSEWGKYFYAVHCFGIQIAPWTLYFPDHFKIVYILFAPCHLSPLPTLYIPTYIVYTYLHIWAVCKTYNQLPQYFMALLRLYPDLVNRVFRTAAVCQYHYVDTQLRSNYRHPKMRTLPLLGNIEVASACLYMVLSRL